MKGEVDMSIYDVLLVLIGAALCQLVHEMKKAAEQERAHAAWVREWRRQNAPRSWEIVRTRHRRMDRYQPRHAAPMPMPLDDMAAQLEKYGKARCVLIRNKPNCGVCDAKASNTAKEVACASAAQGIRTLGIRGQLK